MGPYLKYLIVALVFLVFIQALLDLGSSPVPATGRDHKTGVYLDANGREITLASFTGNYLWLDYAAPWCGYCNEQARTLKRLDKRYGDKLLFRTVITSTEKVMEPPTAKNALSWAILHDLEPDKVLAYFSTYNLPYHELYGPSGELLFHASGLLDESRIMAVLRSNTPAFSRQ